MEPSGTTVRAAGTRKVVRVTADAERSRHGMRRRKRPIGMRDNTGRRAVASAGRIRTRSALNVRRPVTCRRQASRRRTKAATHRRLGSGETYHHASQEGTAAILILKIAAGKWQVDQPTSTTFNCPAQDTLGYIHPRTQFISNSAISLCMPHSALSPGPISAAIFIFKIAVFIRSSMHYNYLARAPSSECSRAQRIMLWYYSEVHIVRANELRHHSNPLHKPIR